MISDKRRKQRETSESVVSLDPLSQEIDSRFKTADDHFIPWVEVAKEDYRFALGDQWDQEDRDKLKEQSRPCLTFNRIRPLINYISGYQKENSARIKVNPEGGEDQIFSEVMDKALHAVDKWSHLGFKMGFWFDDGMYCGKGWIEALRTYEKDPVRGELDFKLRSPYQILVDPDCREYDINEGAKYLFNLVRLSKADLKELYPDKAKIIDGFIVDNDNPVENGSGVEPNESQDDDYGNRSSGANRTSKVSSATDSEEDDEDGMYTLKEYWHKKRVTKYFVINVDDGEPVRFNKKEEAEAFITQQNFGKVIEREVSEMWVAAKACGYVLQDEISPFEPFYSGFPFFRFMADYAPNAEDEVLRVQGLTRPLKDPQREKNKAKSQNLHVLNTQANSGWIGEEDALSRDGWKKLEEMGSKPGLVAKLKKGYFEKIREIQPKGPNAGMIQREQSADEEFKQIVGFNPEFLWGFEGAGASGRAVSMRIKNSIISLVRLFNNYRYSKEIVGKFILQMVPAIFDEKKLGKVLGIKYRDSVKSEAYPTGLSDGVLTAFLQLIKDARYDILITESDQNSTLRFETFQELADIMSKAPGSIPIDILVDFMDVPNKDEIKKKIAEHQQAQLAAATAAKGSPAPVAG